MVEQELYQELYDAIKALNDKERTIIELYYGFGCQRMNQREIG